MADRNQHKPMPIAQFQTIIKSHSHNGRAKSAPNNRYRIPTTISLPEHNETHDARLLAVKTQVRADF